MGRGWPAGGGLVRQEAGGLARARARPGRMKVMTESTRANLASYIMSTLESLIFADPLIRDRVLRGHSHQSIAQELQQQCPSLLLSVEPVTGSPPGVCAGFVAPMEYIVPAVSLPMRSTE